jgi:hypothetical protein
MNHILPSQERRFHDSLEQGGVQWLKASGSSDLHINTSNTSNFAGKNIFFCQLATATRASSV